MNEPHPLTRCLLSRKIPSDCGMIRLLRQIFSEKRLWGIQGSIASRQLKYGQLCFQASLFPLTPLPTYWTNQPTSSLCFPKRFWTKLNASTIATLKNKNIRSIPPNPLSDMASKLDLKGLNTSNPNLLQETVAKSVSNIKPPHPPLESLPCTNVEVTKHNACPRPGTKACSACKLVSYCSPVSDRYLLAPSPLILHYAD